MRNSNCPAPQEAQGDSVEDLAMTLPQTGGHQGDMGTRTVWEWVSVGSGDPRSVDHPVMVCHCCLPGFYRRYLLRQAATTRGG